HVPRPRGAGRGRVSGGAAFVESTLRSGARDPGNGAWCCRGSPWQTDPMTSRDLWMSFGLVSFAGAALLYASSATSSRPAAPPRQTTPNARADIVIDTPMSAPGWATLERQLLDRQTPACVEFYKKY